MNTTLTGAKKFALFPISLLLVVAWSGADPEPPPLSGQDLPTVVREEAGEAMDELLRRAAAFGFAGQVVVEREGKILLHGAYGLAERREKRPMTSTTKVGIASLSKQFTAAAILALREDDRLELDDPLSRFLPDLAPEKGRLTLHQLLSHTSGLPGGDIAGDDFEIAGRDELVRRIDVVSASGEPGERWRYSNAGYNLLAAVVEEVTGKPYEEYVTERIFRPAGMENSGFWHHPEPAPDEVAHSYRAWMDQGSPATWPRNWRVFGTGDVLSTAADLYRWEVALRKGEVLSAESVGLLRTPHAPIGDTGDSYGYGWFLHPEPEGGYTVEHGGDWLGGYNAFHYVEPKDSLVVTITSNATDASGMWLRQAVQKSLIDLASGEEVPLPPAVDATASVDPGILGTYRLPGRSDTLHLFDDGALVWLGAQGQEVARLLLGTDEETAGGLAEAVRKTGRLLGGLLAGDTDAFAEALEEDGLPHLESYRSEWVDLVDRLGPLESFEVLGARGRWGSAGTSVRLSFESGETSYSLRWAEGGHGRLHASLVQDRPGSPMRLPAAFPVAVGADGDLVAYDLFGELGVRIVASRESPGRIVVEPLDGGPPIEAWATGTLVPAADGWRLSRGR